MRTPFKLRSGNTTPFKQMGFSPVKQADFDTDPSFKKDEHDVKVDQNYRVEDENVNGKHSFTDDFYDDQRVESKEDVVSTLTRDSNKDGVNTFDQTTGIFIKPSEANNFQGEFVTQKNKNGKFTLDRTSDAYHKNVVLEGSKEEGDAALYSDPRYAESFLERVDIKG